MNILKKMICATLLYIPFFAFAASTPVIDESTSLRIPQRVAVYSVTTAKSDALKNIIQDIGRKGFVTSTADLKNLENSVLVFRKPRLGDQLTPAILKSIISKHADIKDERYISSAMPDPIFRKTNDSQVAIRNVAISEMKEGNIRFSQGISILDDGFERHSFKDVGVTKDGSVINILMIQPGKYYIVVTTI